jgi:serine/threonine-protein kinase
MKRGRHRLVAELARGGMGVVWLAETRGAGGFAKAHVVKELAPELAGDPRYLGMFLEEARVAARLAHKNIVQTLDLGCEDGRWYVVLELCEGCSLDRARALLGPRGVSPGLAVAIAGEMLAGLDHAHELGVVHRDVTPQNVFLCASGEVKLLDFGLAKSRDAPRRTEPGIVKGSVAYLSPDHVTEATVDRRADVFAAGIILRELLTGERLWAPLEGALDGAAIIRRLAARDVPAWPTGPYADAVPSALRAVCERAMAPHRDARFATADEMRRALGSAPARSLEDLRALFDGPLARERDRARCLLRSHPPAPPPPPETLPSDDLVSIVPPPPPGRRRAAALLAFASVVFLLVLGMDVDHEARRATPQIAAPVASAARTCT